MIFCSPAAPKMGSWGWRGRLFGTRLMVVCRSGRSNWPPLASINFSGAPLGPRLAARTCFRGVPRGVPNLKQSINENLKTGAVFLPKLKPRMDFGQPGMPKRGPHGPGQAYRRVPVRPLGGSTPVRGPPLDFPQTCMRHNTFRTIIV